MFKKFTDKENVSGTVQAKSTVIKQIRAKLCEDYPYIEDYIDEILPKKDNVRVVKCQDHIEILVGTSGEPLFFKQRDGQFVPVLRLLHKYPFMLPPQQVDKGAIKFVLSGANVMCPGLTSPGGKLISADKNTVVAIMAEGKQHALAVGITKMSTDEIQKLNKGIAIEALHYLNDGLWQMKPVK